MSNVYNLFISHSWSHSNSYERLVNLIGNRPYFRWRNYSVPQDDPIHDAPNSQALYEAIKRQVSPSHVVIMLAGVYATYSTWINKEIQIAEIEFFNKKPILAIQPLGAERISSVVRDAADMIVAWNTESVISGIRQLAGQ